MSDLPLPPEPAKPALWNPNAAANWSLLFSPAFGAFIGSRNAEALGQPDEAKCHRRWFYGTVAFLTLTVLSPFIPAFSDGAIRFIGLVILLAWYFSMGCKQARFVKAHYGDTYPKKPWGKPLLIAFACFIGFMIACAAVAFAAALMKHQLAGLELSRGEAC